MGERDRGERRGRGFRAVTAGVISVLISTAPVVGSSPAEKDTDVGKVINVNNDCLFVKPISPLESVLFLCPTPIGIIRIEQRSDISTEGIHIQFIEVDNGKGCTIFIDPRKGNESGFVESCSYPSPLTDNTFSHSAIKLD